MLPQLLSAPFAFRQMQREQWLSQQRIEELQWLRFQKIFTYAYNNTEFYRERFQAAGIHPRDIRCRADIVYLPITTREDLRDPQPLLAKGMDPKKLYSSTTSGSTGRRTTTYFDQSAWLKGKLLLKLRARLACKLRPWDRVALFSEETSTNRGIIQAIFRSKKFSIHNPLATQLAELIKFKPSALYGFPSTILRLAGQGTLPSVKKIFTSSEMLEAGTRQKIESALKGEVFDIFGCTELKEISWECPARCGYHINSDWLLVESLANDASNEEGDAPGRLVVSNLFNFAMPLLRYELGDTGRLLQHSCACGRGLHLMTPSLGRSVDYFTLPNNTAVSPYAMTCAIENIEGMAQYQIRQTAVDHVIVSVVPTSNYRHENLAEIRARLERVLPGVTIEVNMVSRLAREKNGKFRIVASELGVAPNFPSHKRFSHDE